MPLRMFELQPGEGTRYRIALPEAGRMTDLELHVLRPREGLSVELELTLHTRAAVDPVARGRVPLAEGYLAVAREIERQFASALEAEKTPDFELIHLGAAAASG